MAIQALNRGMELFPDDPSLLKVKSNYLAHLGLYRAAIESEEERMALIEADESDYVMLSQLFIESKQINEAIEVLETAMVKFPMSAKVRILLGHSYMEKDMDHTTAHLFKLGAYLDPKYLSDAVEMHRRVKDYPHAIFLNAQMTDKTENLKQKVAIYLDREEFEKIIGLRDGLERYNLLEDDNMRYAFAYANYMAKDYDEAEVHLKMITDPEIYNKGLKILNNIEQCRDNSLECL
jgi:predicted Zn-dependent protease